MIIYLKRLKCRILNSLYSVWDIITTLLRAVFCLCKFLLKWAVIFTGFANLGVLVIQYADMAYTKDPIDNQWMIFLFLFGIFVAAFPWTYLFVKHIELGESGVGYADDPKPTGTYVNGAGQRVNILGGAPSVQNPPKW